MRIFLFIILFSTNVFAIEIVDKTYVERMIRDMKSVIALLEKKVDYSFVCYESGKQNKSNFINDEYCIWLRENGLVISEYSVKIATLYMEMIKSSFTKDALDFYNSNSIINKSIDGEITKISIAEYFALTASQDKDFAKKLLKAGFFYK